MKTFRISVITCLAVLFSASVPLAQVSIGGTPVSFSKSLRLGIPSVTTGTVDTARLLAEDEVEQATKDVPFRFGFPFEVDLTLDNSGEWELLSDGGRIWRLQIESPGAYSINLVYRHFWLPPGARFFVYSQDRSMVMGAFTEANNKEYGQFATAPVKGDICILEYYEPPDVLQPGIIEIERIVHAYRNLFNRDALKDAAGFGSSGSCNNNVNCPEGALWQDDKRAVAMILTSGGWRLCTGSLVNNVREDLTPYFLTANHCLGGEETWVFMFHYESPTCDNIDGPTWMTTSGSIRRANNSYSDFALLELSEQPPDSYNVYYAGWSNLDVPAQSSVAIHHPSGDIKKISFDYDPVLNANYGGSSGGSHWRVVAWNDGTTEPGSSGSPLFDSTGHRIIGQLHGGTASCESITSDYYGKFAKSWDFGSTPATRLKDWLDPDNTGTQELDGIDPAGVAFTGVPRWGNVPLEVQFTGSSFLQVDTWTWDFGDNDSAFVQSPTHTFDTPGTFDVSLEIEAEGDVLQRVKSDYIIALADTLKGADAEVLPNTKYLLTVQANNSAPVNQVIVPVYFVGDLLLSLDSTSTAGCRTDYFEIHDYIHNDLLGRRVTIRLQASASGTAPELEPGSGPIVKLYFSVGSASPGDSTLVDFSGYSSYSPSFSGSLLTYEPEIRSAMLSYSGCCLGIRGNVDNDSEDETNVADLTYLVTYLFGGGPIPVCGDEGNVDGLSTINVADLTYLTAYLFSGGPEPPLCP